ncbi:MAG: VOC family protein [Deltaproteobacteria bacterium]|nr:VOC family protein [Deltaproteobacteria bacterium]
MFKQIDHVAMSVKDMEKAVAFYRDVIGMEKVYDRVFEKPMARLLGIPRAHVRIVHMKLGGFFLELFHYRYPEGREPAPDRQQSDLGLTHIGFMVEDFQGTFRHLKEHGVTFMGEPVQFRPGVYVAYFHGVEHEVCEIREIEPIEKDEDIRNRSQNRDKGVA